MYTKQNLIDSVANEFRIIKHLAEKIPPQTEGYKPTEKQRTTLELLQYLSTIFATATKVILAGTTDAYKTLPRSSDETTIENFADMMDAQLEDIKMTLEKFDDEELAKIVNLYQMGDKTKGAYLVENLTKWTAAYKMQLFLYIKSSGNTSLGTANLWGGVDTPMQG